MPRDLGLRTRVLLFFALIAVAGLAAVGLGLFLGARHAQGRDLNSALAYAGLVAALGILGVTAGVWLLFDENVAKPIERLSADLRSRAHAGVASTMDTNDARYLGDLAPAARAVTGQLSHSSTAAARAVADATQQLAADREQLKALFTDIPLAIVLVNAAHQITLYDGQAAGVLSQIHVPRLNASIFDYFDKSQILAAHKTLRAKRNCLSVTLRTTQGDLEIDARLLPLSRGDGYMIVLDDAHALMDADDARPLVYDFALTNAQNRLGPMENQPLNALNFVVFDTETTGLMPHKDDIVQLGAVRVVNGRIVAGEEMNTLVNPGRPIPKESTKVHGIADKMVTGAPDPIATTERFHAYAQGAVIVAHNAPFDMAFMRRYGKSGQLVWDQPILDTVLLSAILFGASATHTLDALCARLDVTIPAALRHTALGDAHATAEVLCKMLPMLNARGLTTFERILQETRKHGKLLEDLN
ncbi:3'-5' exonuclease [Epibacterium ulvae]|uniref:3'-5' exonuclease n=1 Tax=Epibacterium ulvae TaxID=1156985 RepID=UPI001BFC5FD3|nr:3'-5' exonuclease [Epibacterium ulvae]MBT8156091.1 3'-5' exonuclease [Epibacterium ulvae]